MLKDYGKPVLTSEDNSAYKPTIRFVLENTENKNESGSIKMVFKCSTNSEIIKGLLESGKAYFGIKIRNSMHSKFYCLEYGKDIYEINISRDLLSKHDTIRCTAYALSTYSYHYGYNQELNSLYDESLEFDFNANEIMAESNEELINYHEGDPYIRVAKDSNLEGKGIEFHTGSNVIQIKVGDSLMQAYQKLQVPSNKVNPKSIINSLLAFNAIFYTLLVAVTCDDFEEKRGTELFKAMESGFEDPSGKTLGEVIAELRSGADHDIDTLVNIAQKMVNNSVENSFVKAAEEVNK